MEVIRSLLGGRKLIVWMLIGRREIKMRSQKILAAIGLIVALMLTSIPIAAGAEDPNWEIWIWNNTNQEVVLQQISGGGVIIHFIVSLNTSPIPPGGQSHDTFSTPKDESVFRVKLLVGGKLLEKLVPVGQTVDPDGVQVRIQSAIKAPALSEWSLIALGTLLAGSLAWMIRRKVNIRPNGA